MLFGIFFLHVFFGRGFMSRPIASRFLGLKKFFFPTTVYVVRRAFAPLSGRKKTESRRRCVSQTVRSRGPLYATNGAPARLRCLTTTIFYLFFFPFDFSFSLFLFIILLRGRCDGVHDGRQLLFSYGKDAAVVESRAPFYFFTSH